MMNPDFAIILNFKTAAVPAAELDPDFLVKTARNVGARAIATSQPELFKAAGAKYTIAILPERPSLDLTAANLIDTIVTRRQAGQNSCLAFELAAAQSFTEADQKKLQVLNDWMHLYGHAFNEGQPSKLQVDQDGFVLVNRHASYQKYLFLKTPLPQQVVVTGLEPEPNRVEWIQKRLPLEFDYQKQQLTIKLSEPENGFPWQVVRIQAHRPEDDLAETKF
jgi:hypothetical protein